MQYTTLTMINVFEPSYDKRELAEIEKVLVSGWTGKGSLVDKFEADFSQHLNLENPDQIVTTNSATEGLFAIAELEGWRSGDEVMVPTISFIAAANCVISSQAQVKFVDVDSRTLNVTIDTLNKAFSINTRALILNNYGGIQPNIVEISEWCRERNITLIEDSACAIDSRIGDKYLGTFGDYGIWSLDSMKLISSGDGGIIYCKSLEKMKVLRRNLYLGLSTSLTGYNNSATKNRWWEFNIDSPSRRSIMNDLTAALANVQLRKLPEFVEKRNNIILKYSLELKSVGDLEYISEIGPHRSPYFFWIQTNYRDELSEFLLKSNIYTTFRYYPLNKIEFFNDKESYDGTEFAMRKTLLLPLHTNLTENQIDYIVTKIKSFFGQLEQNTMNNIN